jgi:hypothetical protein
LRQQAHDDELGESDAEPAEGEGYQANRHGGAPYKGVETEVLGKALQGKLYGTGYRA